MDKTINNYKEAEKGCGKEWRVYKNPLHSNDYWVAECGKPLLGEKTKDSVIWGGNVYCPECEEKKQTSKQALEEMRGDLEKLQAKLLYKSKNGYINAEDLIEEFGKSKNKINKVLEKKENDK